MMKGPLGLMFVVAGMTMGAFPLTAAQPAEAGQSTPRPSSTAAAAPRGYVQAGWLLTSQPAGTPNHRVTPPISGTAGGLSGAVGFFVTPTLAMEGAFVAGRPISTPQHFSYDWFENFTGESRDVFLGANARWHPTAAHYLELIGGGGLAFSTFAERSIVRTEFPFPGRPHVPTAEPDRVDTEVQRAVNGGVAVSLPVSRTIAVVPAFMIRFISRPGSGQSDYLGVASYAYHFGATVRFSFD
jgi:hypothetical protein